MQNLSRDADLLIVQKAIQSSTTILVGEDTDLVIPLCYHASFYSHDLFFHPEPKKTQKRSESGTSRSQEKSLVNIYNNIHAVLGCDTTLCHYGIGKLSKFKASMN